MLLTVTKKPDGAQVGVLRRARTEDGERWRLTVTATYGDECRNGHNTLSVTGDLDRWDGRRWRGEACGCIHDAIADWVPELADLCRWHAMTDDGPLHYLANTLFLAGDRDPFGRRAGEPVRREWRLAVAGCPFTVQLPVSLAEFLQPVEGQALAVEAVPVEHDPDPSYDWPPHWHIVPAGDAPAVRWAYAHFSSERRAREVAAALCRDDWRLVSEVVEVAKGKEPELDAARRAAMWPDATLEQLRDRGALLARLPALLAEFAGVLERYGFEPSPELRSAAAGEVATC